MAEYASVMKKTDLDECLSYNSNPPTLTPELQKVIDADRKELSSEFCRGCGYCMPCPKGIQINQCARMVHQCRRPGDDGEDKGMREVRTVHEEVPVLSSDSHTPREEPQRLRRHPQRQKKRSNHRRKSLRNKTE